MKRLQNLSYKTLLTIFIFSLAGIVFFLKIGGKTTKVSAAWWDDAWHYRKAISITNSSGSNLTDFQVSVSIGTSQLIADGKMQTDCDDIRITDINGNLLPYWIEENNPGCNQLTDTKVWLKANSLPTSGSTVYVYYGNPSANNNENGDNVFEFFDDFNNANKTNLNWTATGTGFTVTGGNLYHSTTLEPTNSFTTYTINNSSGFTNGIIESRMKPASCGNSYGKGITSRYSNDNNQYIAGLEAWTGNYTHVGRRVNGTWTNIDQDPLTCSTSTWYQFKWTLNGTSQLLSVNGVASSGVDSSFSSGKVGVHVDNRETATGAYWDYLFVHKYASSDPTTSNQSEESGGGPIAYWKFDEGVGTTAYDSAGSNNGTLTGSTLPEWQTEENCISGKCLNFNGINSQISISNPEQINILGSFSVEGWIYLNNIPSVWEGTLMSKNSTGPVEGFGFGIRGNSDSTNKGKLIFYTQQSTPDTTYLHTFGNRVLEINKWYFISATYNKVNGLLNLYIDGKLDKSTTININITNNSMTPYIGQLRANYGVFPGKIDEVRFYPYARTADQIKLDYNSRGSLSGSSVNLGIQSNTGPSLKSSLIASYTFDENQGTKVYNSAGTSGIDGTMRSNSSRANKDQCIKNGCVFINDTATSAFNTISAPDSDLFSNLNQITVSVWIKTIISGKANGQQIIYKRQSNGSPSWASFTLNLSSTNKPSFTIYDTNGSGSSINSSVAIEANKWYHLIGIYTGSQLKLYINGQSVASPVNKTGIILNSNDQLMIGGLDTNYYVSGYIDELKIYNTALTDEQVKQDYNQGSAISFGQTTQNIGGTTTSLNYCIPGDTSYCAAPVAEYNFEENTGTTAKDTSGNNNNGAFGTGNSAPTWTIGANNKGAGVNFDGINDYIEVPSLQENNLSNFTICSWVYTNVEPTNDAVFAYSVGGSTRLYFTYNSSTSVKVGLSDWNPTITTNNLLNKWMYHCLSLEGTRGRYYLNGSLISENNSITVNLSDASTFKINHPSFPLQGKIDGIKIYNYARTPAQIAYDYNKGAPVGWWKFDECQGSTAFDASGLGNTGTISIGLSGSQTSLGTCQTGTSAAWTNGSSGHSNGSLNFDGIDDYVDMGTTIGNNYSNISVSAWIYPTSTNTGTIIAKNGPFYLGWTSQKARGSIYNGTSWVSTTGNTTLSLNQWHHLLMTYNGTNINVYVDGKYDGTNTTSGSLAVTSAHVQIGGNTAAGFNQYFIGQIDDVRIYNYSLTDEQIKQVYNGGAINFQ